MSTKYFLRNFHVTDCIRSFRKNPYQILGVSNSANQNEIKKAYYLLAKKYHPDTNKDEDARERFAQIQEAYEILTNTSKRSQFDQNEFGFDGFKNTEESSKRSRFYQRNHGFPGGVDPNDVFNEFFGGTGSYKTYNTNDYTPDQSFRQRSGENIQIPLTITFMEAAKGTEKYVTIEPVVSCSTCQGSGLKRGITRQMCKSCHGTGIETTTNIGFPMKTKCNDCHGTGYSNPNGSECHICHGVGKVREKMSVKVDIPPGVDNQSRIKIPRQGDAPMGGDGPRGDLFILLNIEPSTIFRRQDKDVFIDTEVPFYIAVLGGSVNIPTLDGNIHLTIPKGSQADDKITLHGHGIQSLKDGSRGDQIITLKIKLPRILSDEQHSLMKKLASLMDPNFKYKSDLKKK
ncbi:unnamed protein product [Cunninghamella echinulata]